MDMTTVGQWAIAYWVPVLAVLIFVVVLTWLAARRTPTNVMEGVGMALQAATIARELTMAAEQLYLKGDLPKDERFEWVRKQLAAKFPTMDPEELIAIIEGAVYWLKQMSKAPAPVAPAAASARLYR